LRNDFLGKKWGKGLPERRGDLEEMGWEEGEPIRRGFVGGIWIKS
jgi:hypothetical protein